MKADILILGADGQQGTIATRFLRGRGHRLACADIYEENFRRENNGVGIPFAFCDHRDQMQILKLVRRVKPKVVLNCANDFYNDNVIDACKACGAHCVDFGSGVPETQRRLARHKALQALGWKECLVVVSPLSDAKNRQLRIVDNKTGEFARWDEQKLIAELNEMSDRAAMAVYFGGDNLENLLAHSSPSAAPDVTDGDVRQAGENLNERVGHWQAGKTLVDVTCQHCGETFQLDREEMKRRS
ncbi:MAG: saccharopine dehydrogenase NADP-binding domain-containing protein [Patescibacteria group bacterium]|nr:saccharopine dehydrogenase NADP-binding domain-containing protein [Patescibacteria group bacterium]